MNYIELEYWQLAIATSLILISGAISLALQLGWKAACWWPRCGPWCNCC